MSSTFVIFGLLLAGIIVLVAWASEILSRVTRIPNIVFYLVFAIILGPIGVRFLHPGIIIPNLDLLDLVIAISLALIVFEGDYSFNRCFRTITDEEGVHTFQSGLVQLAIASVFLLLTAFITWDLLYVTLFTPFFLAGFVVVGLLILVIRPLGVLVSTLRTKITVRERLFMSFFGPRGIVIAATGVFFSITLQLDYGIVYP